ncbi:MAG TPA: Eco57I restriction-modification methylase domain-containing protein, partial [Chthoniobacterales bacterium]
MEGLLADARVAKGPDWKPPLYSHLAEFERVLSSVADHHNERYFIFKSIILHNLYGVDIMEEAVEICKLRLFLKLAAQVEPDSADKNLGIEPLPDIDFNIRAGNTLVGYATRAELEAVGRADLLLKEQVEEVLEAAEDAAAAYEVFVRSQLEGENPAEFKRRLLERFGHAREKCDRFLAESYFGELPNAKKFADWKRSHQPFHWFVEFFGILNAGGFDVIIGNPPYVEYKKVIGTYRLPREQYASENAANLYAFCMERSGVLLRQNGYFGMIVPTSLVGLDETECVRRVLLRRFNANWFSTYAIRPSKLFDGVDQRLCIHIGTRAAEVAETQILTSGYQHWSADERQFLFSRISFTVSFNHPRLKRIPQVGDRKAVSILLKLEKKMPKSADYYYANSSRGMLMHYHRSPRYWIRGMDFEQYFKSPTRDRSVHHFRDIYFADKAVGKFVGGLINSTLFFFWFLAVGNGRNVTGADIEKFPVGDVSPPHLAEAADAFDRLMKDYKRNSIVRVRADCEFQEFRPSFSKPILDEIDAVLAGHYGFTEEELDFVVNYDIKYRLGRDAGEEE